MGAGAKEEEGSIVKEHSSFHTNLNLIFPVILGYNHYKHFCHMHFSIL